MKNHKSKILILLSAMFLFSIVFALSINAKAGQSVDVNLTMPNMRVGTQGNITYNGTDTIFTDSVFCAVFMRSPSTANSTDSMILNTTNSSNRNHVNFTFTRGLDNPEDSDDYTAYAICYLNATAGSTQRSGNSTALTSRVVDMNAPSLPINIVPIGTQTNNTLDIVTTIVGANTTLCRLEFIGAIPNGASINNAMTEVGNICSMRFTSVSDSTYQYRIMATDGLNSTTTVSQFITIGSDEPNLQGLGALKQVEIQQQQQQNKSNNNNNLFFLIIGVIVIYAILNKKGRR